MASGHILLSLTYLANNPPHQPPGQYPFLGLGGPVSLPGASGASSHHQVPGSYPFYYEVKGLNGLVRPFRPPMVSMARGPHGPYRPWNPLGPFWHKFNEAIRGLSVGPPDPLKTPENHVLAEIRGHPKMTIWDFSPQDFNHDLWKSPS
ncbi:hypothetical protein O181_015528 [Austropuccinia psidii MF-1]|uniref:Uncharacterized protein n=1 Tax=Austropuccinia psidii MF-1 TaxID=1389203 RepID=A0A9Q3C3E1_9BASI|nr:hypothetical protein [Austropuccinia psidii MF-1]